MSVVSVAPYRAALASPGLRSALVLGAFVRIPVFSAGVLLTVHVVTTLGESYAAAGLLAAVATVAIAVSGPWRGRLLDRIGLRRVVLPSTLVALVCWSVAPWVGYLPLLVLAGLAGLFVIPTFSIIRQAVIAAVPPTERRTAISLDSVAVEISFIVGPAVSIWAAAHWDTRWVQPVPCVLRHWCTACAAASRSTAWSPCASAPAWALRASSKPCKHTYQAANENGALGRRFS